MAETIAVLSLKGGTGKTTTVRTLADVLRRVGLDVLAIDLDPQGNLSDYFDVPPDATPTIADVLSGDAKAKAAIHDGIVPATPILAEVERSMSGKMGRELVLRKALKDARKQHDVVLIDCPPALGLLTINGLVAADLRFDDATVSRRHALVVNQAEGVRVLDDRSLNGIYVNGRRVEWSPLADGDEVTIGRHSLFFMDTAEVGAPVPAPAVTGE